MYVPLSSNSLLLMIRLFTLATISSMMAPSDVGTGAIREIRAMRRMLARLVVVFARVLEGEDGAVDMDLRVFLEVGDVAVERLLPLPAEQLQLGATLHLRGVGLRRLHLAHQLHDQVVPGVFQNGADLPRLEFEGRLLDLPGQV